MSKDQANPLQDQLTQINEYVDIEVKTQTIYYEDTAGNIDKYYHTGNERINMTKAENILNELGINVSLILRVVVERANIQMSRSELNDKIVESERYYKK